VEPVACRLSPASGAIAGAAVLPPCCPRRALVAPVAIAAAVRWTELRTAHSDPGISQRASARAKARKRQRISNRRRSVRGRERSIRASRLKWTRSCVCAVAGFRSSRCCPCLGWWLALSQKKSEVPPRLPDHCRVRRSSSTLADSELTNQCPSQPLSSAW